MDASNENTNERDIFSSISCLIYAIYNAPCRHCYYNATVTVSSKLINDD